MSDAPTRPPRRRIAGDSPRTSIPPNSNGDKSTREKRAENVIDLIGYTQLPFLGLAAVHEQQHPGEVSPWALDAYAIELHKPSLATAVVNLADEYPVLGAVLDKVSIGGPIMGLFVSVLTLGAQLAENHGARPELMKSIPLGTINRQDLAQSMMSTKNNDSTSDSDAS